MTDSFLCGGQFGLQDGVLYFEFPDGLPEVPDLVVLLGR
jgi:hypothetical protein